MILRAANNCAFSFTVVHLANREFIRGGYFVFGEDLGDDDAFEFSCDFLDAFNFEAEHGQALRQLLGRRIEIHVLLEPIECDFHRS